MAQKVNVRTPQGEFTYTIHNDNRELEADFIAGAVAVGEDIIYRGLVCEVLGDFTDGDGVKYTSLLVKGGLGGGIQFGI